MSYTSIPDHIFRHYDIRGIVGSELTPDIFQALGLSYGKMILESLGKSPKVVVGHDNRASSQELTSGLIKGLTDSGTDVFDLGTVPTPTLYWAEIDLSADGSIQVTGSHNPPEWNGAKMTVQGSSLYGDSIQKLKQNIIEHRTEAGKETGAVKEVAIIDRYIEDLTRRFDLNSNIKVVLDCGNGTGSLVGVEILQKIGAEVIPLYCDSDCTFPNHHPDPAVDEYLADLIDIVQKEKADLGIAFDGDADRIGVVDDKGNILRADRLLLLLALDVLHKQGPGQKLIYDVKCSQILHDEFARAGGEPIMWKTGHSLIKEKMRDTGALIAGEFSGHIFFADNYWGFDDAPYTACRLLDLVAQSQNTISEMMADFPVYHSTSEFRFDVTEESKLIIVHAAQEHFMRNHEVINLDGSRILFEDGWGLLRASNTQPAIVARYEAVTEAGLVNIREEVESFLESQGVEIGNQDQ